MGKKIEKDARRRHFVLVEVVGIAPLAARPAPTLSMSSFADNIVVDRVYRRQGVLPPQNGPNPQFRPQVR